MDETISWLARAGNDNVDDDDGGKSSSANVLWLGSAKQKPNSNSNSHSNLNSDLPTARSTCKHQQRQESGKKLRKGKFVGCKEEKKYANCVCAQWPATSDSKSISSSNFNFNSFFQRTNPTISEAVYSNKRHDSNRLETQLQLLTNSNNKSTSYSNLIRQYLPPISLNSLSLGLRLHSNRRSRSKNSPNNNNKSNRYDERQIVEKKRKEEKCVTVNDQSEGYSASSSKFIANALNRLKLSSALTNNNQPRVESADLCAKNKKAKQNDTSRLLERRRGFLYLKKGSYLSHNTGGDNSSSLLNSGTKVASWKQQSVASKSSGDSNNNDISSLLFSGSNNFQSDQNVDSDEEQCGEEQQADGGKSLKLIKGRKSLQVRRSRKKWEFFFGQVKEEGRKQEKGSKMMMMMMIPASDEVGKCCPRREPKKVSSSSDEGESSERRETSTTRTLLLTGGGMMSFLLVALLVFGASVDKQVVVAQQHLAPQQQVAPAPFRSQSQSQSQAQQPLQSPIGQPSQESGREQQQAGRPKPAAGSLVANINCNKIKGHVTLSPNGGQSGGGCTVSTQISSGPTGEVYQWSIHQFPVKPGAAMCSCSPMILGAKLVDLSEMHGNLPGEQEFTVQSSLNLFGSDSPVGHSLMLRGLKTGMLACATFLPTSRKSNYRAKFHTPLSGSVSVFQTAFGSSLVSHLMYSNGSRRHSMHRFDLVKSEEDMVTSAPPPLLGASPSGQRQPSSGASLANQEQLAWEQREHEHELAQCKRFSAGEPLFRNISYQLSVSTENFGMRGRTAWVLPQIPFETFSSVFVIIYSEHDPSEPIACAPLRFVKPKTAAAKFQSVSVQGSIILSQDSPYDPTIARINLNLPNSDGHSYGIDELPMIIRRKSDTRVCPNIREIIYNPHHIEPSSVPAEGEATSDQYAVGDLSGKYGSLTGKSVEKLTLSDYNLPLYGPISVVGRAMTIYSADGVAIACSNIELTSPMTTAFATFDFGIQGQFIFRQPVNDCNGDTYVYIEVSKPVAPGSSAAPDPVRSLDHNWHIHVNPVDSGLDHLSTTDCHSAGPHYNPYNTSTGSIYSRDCTPFNVLRCELGDLSAKMFTIEIPPYRVKGAQEPDIGKFFGTDIDLPLCGPVSIVNRSVVVHVQDFGHQRLACSTVIEFKPRISAS